VKTAESRLIDDVGFFLTAKYTKYAKITAAAGGFSDRLRGYRSSLVWLASTEAAVFQLDVMFAYFAYFAV
jgi:hypothetical protein